MAERKILVRRASASDLGGISDLYVNYMFDSYLLRFGEAFVKRYLQIIIDSRDCLTLVAIDDGIAGFIMGTFNSKKIISKLIMDIGLMRLWAAKVLSRRYLAGESLELLFYPFKTGFADIDAELLFIAIHPDYRKRKLASSMIAQALDLMRQKNIGKVKVSVQANNPAVCALLKEKGFEVRKNFMLFKKEMHSYSLDLNI